MTFGPHDGLLYATLGDKYTHHYLTSSKHYAGCVVRIRKDGSIPDGNLPSNVKPAACWAHGLRNGWASTWDKGRLIVAEVGGNDGEILAEEFFAAAGGRERDLCPIPFQ